MKKVILGVGSLLLISYIAFGMGRGESAPVNLEKFNGLYLLDSSSDGNACPDQLKIAADTDTRSVSITPDWLGSEHPSAMVLGTQYCNNDTAETFVRDCDSIVLNGDGNSLIRVYTSEQNPMGFVPSPPPETTVTESYTLEGTNQLRLITKTYHRCYYNLKGAN